MGMGMGGGNGSVNGRGGRGRSGGNGNVNGREGGGGEVQEWGECEWEKVGYSKCVNAT